MSNLYHREWAKMPTKMQMVEESADACSVEEVNHYTAGDEGPVGHRVLALTSGLRISVTLALDVSKQEASEFFAELGFKIGNDGLPGRKSKLPQAELRNSADSNGEFHNW